MVSQTRASRLVRRKEEEEEEEEEEEQRYGFSMESCVFWVFGMISRVFPWRLVPSFSRVLWRDHINPRISEVMWVKP